MTMTQEDWYKRSMAALIASLIVLQTKTGRSQTNPVGTATSTPAIAQAVQPDNYPPEAIDRSGGDRVYTLYPRLDQKGAPPRQVVDERAIELDGAYREYKRYQNLYQEGAVSRQAFDDRAAAYREAQVRYAASRDQRGRLRQSATNQTVQAQLAEAEDTLQLAQLTYARYRTLYQEGAISAEQLSDAAKDYEAALSRRDRLQKQVRSRHKSLTKFMLQD